MSTFKLHATLPIASIQMCKAVVQQRWYVETSAYLLHTVYSHFDHGMQIYALQSLNEWWRPTATCGYHKPLGMLPDG
jgi:sulfur relay (sulfurtransferase) complex TusBCD TusD component (DsrE family)